MENKISVDQIAQAVSDMMGEYHSAIVKKIDVSGKTVAVKAVKKLKETSPVRIDNKARRYASSGKSYTPGSYAKGWAYSEEKDVLSLEPAVLKVWNKKHYSITHLLENGHRTRNGGRTRAIKHIKPVETEVISAYEAEVKGAIESESR